MSTKFYIKDENGIYLSVDGKTKYSMLEGKSAYDFLSSEEGQKRSFYVEVDENGDKLGIEGTPNIVAKFEPDQRHTRYLRETEVECKITFVSSNVTVSVPGEEDIELEDMLDNGDDLVEKVMHNIDLEILRNALKMLSDKEYELIYDLYLSEEPLNVRELGEKYGVHFVTISKWRKSILSKLKKYF